MISVFISAAKSNHIQFGDCQINDSRTLTFTMTNHASDESVRFVWADHPQLRVSPHVGHLHAGCAKDMAVTFCTDAPVTLEQDELSCRVTRINFETPVSHIPDWDDSKRSIKWINSAPSPAGSMDRLEIILFNDDNTCYVFLQIYILSHNVY